MSRRIVPFAALSTAQRRAALDAEGDLTDAVSDEALEEGWSRDDLTDVVYRHADEAGVVIWPAMRHRIIEAASRQTRADWRRSLGE